MKLQANRGVIEAAEALGCICQVHTNTVSTNTVHVPTQSITQAYKHKHVCMVKHTHVQYVQYESTSERTQRDRKHGRVEKNTQIQTNRQTGKHVYIHSKMLE